MIKISYKKAFSLTELLIVLVIAAVLFAAMAPIVTKRRSSASFGTDEVWNYVNDDDQINAFYDPGLEQKASIAFIGGKFDSGLNSTTKNKGGHGKLTIFPLKGYDKYAKQDVYNPHFIQFRYGDGLGQYIGSLYIPQKYLNGSKWEYDYGIAVTNQNDRTHTGFEPPYSRSTIFGYNSMNHADRTGSSLNNLAFGANTLSGTVNQNPLNLDNNLAIGSGAGSNFNDAATNNLIIGSKTAQVSPKSDKLIAIGAKSLSVNENTGGSGSTMNVTNDIYLGYGVQNAYAPTGTTEPNNIIAGTTYSYRKGLNRSIILGYGAYTLGNINYTSAPSGTQPGTGITAIGYNACNGFPIKTNTSGSAVMFSTLANKTCIGYRSGAFNAVLPGEESTTLFDDQDERIFLGGSSNWFADDSDVPPGGNDRFAGRAVMEIHNPQLASKKPAVVLNSNLVVRGGLFSTLGYSSADSLHYNLFLQDIDSTSPSDAHCIRDIGIGALYYKMNENDTGYSMLRPCIKYAPDGTCEEYQRINYACTHKSNYGTAKSSSIISFKKCSEYSTDPNIKACMDYEKLSDERLKENISENNDGLKELLSLNLYNYTFKNDPQKRPQVGVVAQELKKVFPNAIYEDEEGYLKIRWDEMFYAAINAIKTLSAKVEKLATSISQMESDVKTLKTDNKLLRKKIATLNSRAAKLEKK